MKLTPKITFEKGNLSYKISKELPKTNLGDYMFYLSNEVDEKTEKYIRLCFEKLNIEQTNENFKRITKAECLQNLTTSFFLDLETDNKILLLKYTIKFECYFEEVKSEIIWESKIINL